MIEFHSEIPVGFELSIKGQRICLLRTEPHVRRDGADTRLMVWETRCAECQEWAETRSPLGKAPEGRRCEAHRKPGVRVGK